MERESFEDKEVAAILNVAFVAIKVDREKRPDIDQIYMNVCQAIIGQGGWPLTVIVTPDKQPVFAGTYFSKQSKWGKPGLVDILETVSREWQKRRAELISYSESITAFLTQEKPAATGSEVKYDILDDAYKALARDFDNKYGGFGAASKVSLPHSLLFLLRYWKHLGKNFALAMVENTLTNMRRGGIYDQLVFGFSRYSTDISWFVPHFEKMLYDNALLCYAYIEAYQCSGNADFTRVAEEFIAYVVRDMTAPTGGFYSAEDADSEGVGGKVRLFRNWVKS